MPVGSFVRGTEPGVDDGVVHAGEPQDGTSVCGGVVLAMDVDQRSFVAWVDGACPRCSEALDPTAAPTPAPEPGGPTFGGTG